MSRRLAVLALLAATAAGAARAQQPVNPIHPLFAPLDAAGRKVRTFEEMSVEKTCGACHDAAYIASHTGHAAPKVSATCVQCHVDGGALDVRPETLEKDGRLRREAIRIGAPRAGNCGACHGLVPDAGGAVAIPADLEAIPRPGSGRTASRPRPTRSAGSRPPPSGTSPR